MKCEIQFGAKMSPLNVLAYAYVCERGDGAGEGSGEVLFEGYAKMSHLSVCVYQ